jgi:hypothetical protein
LTGSHFTGATSVKFGTVSASSFFVASDTQITATAPAETAVPANVTVTTVGGGTGASNVYFYYIPAPTLTSVAPSQGPVSGGTSVILTGSHFTGATSVKFGTVSASSFSVASDTQITATAPAEAAGSVNVTVTTAGGTSNSFTYFYLPAPTLTSVLPGQGPSGGTSATLTGTQLTTANAVMFGSAPATSYSVLSDSSIVAVAPAGTGTVQVTVTTSGGASNGLAYTFVSAPQI